MKYANTSPLDSLAPDVAKGLFNDLSDQEYHNNYPTIYHLRYALMTEPHQFDLREIYLALHHIVKYRGHFLNPAPTASFRPGKLDLGKTFTALNEDAAIIFDFEGPLLPITPEILNQTTDILLNQEQSRADRQKAIVALLNTIPESDKDSAKKKKAVLTELVKASLGLQVNAASLLVMDADAFSTNKLYFAGFQDWFDANTSQLTEDQMNFLDTLNSLYGQVQLSAIIPSGKTLSEGMIERYEHHQGDLKMLKDLRNHSSKKKSQELKAAYHDYIAGTDKSKPLPYADFLTRLKKIIGTDESPLAQQILGKIEQSSFLPKQRNSENGVIPHQVQQQEFDRIIENQKAYYPWLAEKNPVSDPKRVKNLPYMLDELVGFRVPYYVGPMITAEKQAKTSGASFAWMVRKEAGAITPWNFTEKVDKTASAAEFINRMKTPDTYLLGEDVLPKQSLLYQKFEVLNELNNIRVDGRKLARDTKQRLFNQLCMHHSSVTVRMIQDNLVTAGEYKTRPDVKGLSDPKKMISRYSTYQDLQQIIPEQIDQPQYQNDIEKIVAWATLFEDQDNRREMLVKIPWLSAEQRRKLALKRYRGWGSFSKKLLTGIVDDERRTVMDCLWETSKNFMEIVGVTDSDFAKKIKEQNDGQFDAQMSADDVSRQTMINDIIDGFYTSPANKKAIREVFAVVKDIQKAMHGQKPQWIFIEAAREPGQKGRRTKPRETKLQDTYKELAKDVAYSDTARELAAAVKDKAKFTDLLTLYFQQNGRDIYTGLPLNIDQLSLYEIDHIIPQAVKKDDSLDNRVLTAKPINNTKAAHFAADRFGAQMNGFWHQLNKAGLISNTKLFNLSMRETDIDKYAPGFIQRQLVETRQIIKLTTQLLDQEFGSDTKIISVRASLSHQFRKEFDFPKIRSLNDYHHAFDAFLAARLGLYLLQRYPSLSSLFTYGDYTPFATKLRTFDFIGALASKEPLANRATGEIVWDNEDELAYCDYLYGLKKILVAHEVYTNNGPMFNATIYKRGSKDANVPTKKNRPTNLYGGYTSVNRAYLAIVRIVDQKKGDYLRVMPVFTLWLNDLQKAYAISKNEGLETLRSFLSPKLSTKKGVPEFSIVADKVFFHQRVIHDKYNELIGGDQQRFNCQQLWLSRDDQRTFIESAAAPSTQKNCDKLNGQLISLYQRIIRQLNQYFRVYDDKQLGEKLVKAESQFRQLPVESTDGKVLTKQLVLLKIMESVHANGFYTTIPELQLSEFGRLQYKAGVRFPVNTLLVNESPTGLFFTTKKLN